MLSYEKYRGVNLPFTGMRYFFDLKKKIILDRFDDSEINQVNGVWNLPHSPYPENLTEDELYLLTHKPMFMDRFDFFRYFRTQKIKIISKPNTTPARNTRFWKLDVVCSHYRNFYYIPGFTNYVISREGVVISLITGRRLSFSNSSTGYPACRMNRDDGRTSYVQLHNLLGLTFKDWSWDIVDLVIDHVDGDKLNYDLVNLEWVTDAENKRRAQVAGLIPNRAIPIYCYDIQTTTVHTFVNQTEVARYLNIPRSTIQNHLNKPPTNTFLHDRYFVAYRVIGVDGKYIDGFDFDNPYSENLQKLLDSKIRDGSQPKPVLMKSISTGEITEFPSVVKFLEFSGLTRKQAYPRLKSGKQRRYGDVLFKYKDDDSEWLF